MLLQKLLLVLLVSSALAQFYDRDCPCTLGSLWVDVAVAIDVSAGMGNNGLIQVLADVGTVFVQSSISQVQGLNSRVGIATYDNKPYTNFNMSYFNSTNQLENEIWSLMPSNPITNSQSIVKVGLQRASELLAASARPNVRQAIIIYASDYSAVGENDPTELADALKASGISIITVSFNQGGESDILAGLSKLASPGMFVDSEDADPVGQIQRNLCQVNCYCPNSWRQYADDFAKPQHRFGECIKFGQVASAWTPAKFACQNLQNHGYLSSVFTQSKVDYLKAMAQADTTFSAPHDFLVGLESLNGVWQWEQGQGVSTIVADNSTLWATGFPNAQANVDKCGVLSPLDTKEQQFALRNVNCNTVAKRYACQVITCDTDNYCA